MKSARRRAVRVGNRQAPFFKGMMMKRVVCMRCGQAREVPGTRLDRVAFVEGLARLARVRGRIQALGDFDANLQTQEDQFKDSVWQGFDLAVEHFTDRAGDAAGLVSFFVYDTDFGTKAPGPSAEIPACLSVMKVENASELWELLQVVNDEF